jgi:tripartite-type tricarboxylate transporter receptor subunit TctC
MRFSLLLASLFTGLGLHCAAGAAPADPWPNRPLKLIVPFPPGGAADAVGRVFADRLAEALKQRIVVENKPGAGTAIAAEAAARAAPDGYTLSLAPTGQLAILPHLNRSIPYDPLRDFAPVALLATVPYVIGAGASALTASVKDLVSAAKRAPGRLTYSSCGIGTLCHLSGELFQSQTGTDLIHVAYKGSAPAIVALIGGEVDVAFDTLTVLAPQVKGGRLKALAVTAPRRSPLLPDVPTAAEAGLAGFEVSSWFGLVVPAATPKEIVRRLSEELGRIALLPEVRDRLAGQGLDTAASTPEAFARTIRDDHARWGRIVQAAGVTLD